MRSIPQQNNPKPSHIHPVYHFGKRTPNWKSLTGLAAALIAANVLAVGTLSAEQLPGLNAAAKNAGRQGWENTTNRLPGRARFGQLVEADTERFYISRQYKQAWGEPGMAEQLAQTVRDLDEFGLDPARYEPGRVDAWAAQAQVGDFAADVELTRTALAVARHLASGLVDPDKLQDYIWAQERLWVDPTGALLRGLVSGRPGPVVLSFAPQSKRHADLLAYRSKYRTIVMNGGWPEIPAGTTLKPANNPDPVRVAKLEERLAAEGYITWRGTPVLDEALMAGVSEYQRRQGLDVDGMAGKSTLESLNKSADSRLMQIEANLERSRWSNAFRPPRRIEVNIPEYSLAMIKGDQIVGGMRTAVGEPDWATPSFNDMIRYAVFNPYWHVPPTITGETVQKIRSDSTYFQAQRFEVLQGDSVITPDTIDWATVSEDNFDYRFRQQPGANNALGRMKFMFPNRFAVYLHDTPSIAAFEQPMRAVSHGCIRVQDPMALAGFLFAPDSTFENKLGEYLVAEKQRYVNLPEAVPVYLDYNTVFVDSTGVLNFREDIYGLDREIGKHLAEQNGALVQDNPE